MHSFPIRVLSVFCLCFVVGACSDKEGDSPANADDDPIQVAEAISETVGRLEVRVDPRIELINIVENAKSFEEKHLREPTMKQEISNYFMLYRDHPAVGMMQELRAMGFTYTRPRFFILGCTDPPELRQLYPLKQLYPYSHIHWIPDEETLAEFRQGLRDFYNDAKFGTFYHEHQADYERLLDVVATDLRERDYITLIEDYFGMRKDEYVLVYSPISSGGFGIWIEAEGKITVYAIMPHGYVPWLLHEFGHTFVNPITDEFRDEIDQYHNLFPSIRNDLPSYYTDWYTAVNEHIIRAFTARMETILDGEEAGKWALERELSDGFKYIVPMYERLEEYEANRDKYPDFRSFYPRIVDLFAELSSDDIQ